MEQRQIRQSGIYGSSVTLRLAVVQLTEEAQAGRIVYDRVCVACHGRNLETAGVAAQDLRKFPIDEKSRFIRSVMKGSGDMPPFASLLSEAEISEIFEFVRAVQATGP